MFIGNPSRSKHLIASIVSIHVVYKSLPVTVTSSKYTPADIFLLALYNATFITAWKNAGAVNSPNGNLIKQNKPS